VYKNSLKREVESFTKGLGGSDRLLIQLRDVGVLGFVEHGDFDLAPPTPELLHLSIMLYLLLPCEWALEGARGLARGF
jgi:hypothetical protein